MPVWKAWLVSMCNTEPPPRSLLSPQVILSSSCRKRRSKKVCLIYLSDVEYIIPTMFVSLVRKTPNSTLEPLKVGKYTDFERKGAVWDYPLIFFFFFDFGGAGRKGQRHKKRFLWRITPWSLSVALNKNSFKKANKSWISPLSSVTHGRSPKPTSKPVLL